MLLIIEEEKSKKMNDFQGGVKVENSAEISKLEEMLVSKLNEVKDIMNNQRDTLAVSVRRDVVAIQLKDIMTEHVSYYALKNALEEYIKDLYSIVEEGNEDEGNE